MTTAASTDRLLQAERQGLRLAILCRTLAITLGLIWYASWPLIQAGTTPNPWAIAALFALAAFGFANLAVIGTRFDRWWLKYVIYAADILSVCALFAVVPLSRGNDVPQILAFRAYGIHYLFPLVAMAALSLSWRLVVWSGLMAVIGWWAAFGYVVSGMDQRISWGDLSQNVTREEYLGLFLSPDFIGVGNRVEETAMLLIATLILAIAVYRARRVFFAQIAAEAEREQERAARERITTTLGRYVPEAIARRLAGDESALAPQVRHGAVLVMDIAGFTSFAAERDPTEVIETLNGFLAGCADVISEHDGVVITFTGDGLLATFNTPIEIEAPEQAALRAAHALVDSAADNDFAIRVGIAAGPLAAGSVGSTKRQAFTVYGDTVNRAARLEALAKDLGETILVDEGVSGVPDQAADLRRVGSHALRGLSGEIDVWAADLRKKAGA